MKIVKYQGTIDALEYPKYLVEVAHLMPSGACNFASNEQHYDFYKEYCVHDLAFHSITIKTQY